MISKCTLGEAPLYTDGQVNKMKNEMKNDEAVSPVIATILMVAITVVLAGVLYVWASELAGNQTEAGSLNQYKAEDHPSATTAGKTDNPVSYTHLTLPTNREV